MSDLKRNDIVKINQLLEIFPVILILGVRQCGKTTLAKQARPQWKYFDLENISDFDFISNDLDFFFKEYQTSVIIGANTFTATTNVLFDGGNVNAVAMDVYTNGIGPITITLFDLGGGVIGTVPVGTVPSNEPIFVGFTSLTPIASINISDDGDLGELLDNLYFGSLATGFGPAKVIPSLNLAGLISLLLMLGLSAWYFRNKASQQT